MIKIARLLSAVAFLAISGTFSACKKTFDEPPGPADPQIVANTTIATLKALHTVAGQLDIVNDNIIVSGIVTANDKSGNLYKEIYVEDSTGAIKLLLDATGLYATYPVGRRIFILAKGLYLSDDAGNMILGSRSVVAGTPSLRGILSTEIPKYVKAGSILNPVTPTVVTVAQLGTNMQNPFIGRLIKLQGFEFSPSDTTFTYGDTSFYKADRNTNIQDCNSTRTIIRSSAYSNFAPLKVPNGNGDLTAIYTVFRTTKQFVIRDTADVQFNNPRCGALPPGTVVLLSENFEGLTVPTTAPYPVINLTGWTNLQENGPATPKLWDARSFGGNKYAYISGFGTAAPTVTSWLVTKGVNLNATTIEKLSFKTIQGFILTTTPGGTPVQAGLKVLVSTNYTGTGNPWAAGVTWTDLSSQASFSPGSTTSTFPAAFTASGQIDLSSYTGTIYVAFRYEGADPAGTASDRTSAWEVDDILITGL